MAAKFGVGDQSGHSEAAEVGVGQGPFQDYGRQRQTYIVHQGKV